MRITQTTALARALRESGLLDEDQLKEVGVLQKRFGEPKALADELVRRGWLTPYQAEQLLGGTSRGLVLGQYILMELLGEGGMGQVFKARHRLMRRVVALKVIHPDWLSNHNAVHRFHREIQAVAQLSHPNMVIAHDADHVGDTHFLVMEYVDGVDLATLVHKVGRLPVGQACEFIRQAAEGLQHAHERGLVHRDIKPSNLLLSKPGHPGTGPGVVKILDMGLARLHALGESEEVAHSTALTQEGAVMGTADYISPEQATDAHRADIRSDLYSLGCTFYFLLTGQPPFPGGTFMEKLFKHKLEAPRSVRSVRAEVPPEVAAIVNKMLAKLPEDRYQTPAEAAAALAPFCDAGSPVPASRADPLAGGPADASSGRVTPSPDYLGETQLPDPPPAPAASGVDLVESQRASAAGSNAAPPAWAPTGTVSAPEPGPAPQPGPAASSGERTRTEPPASPLAGPLRKRLLVVGLLLGVGLAAGAGIGAAVLLRKTQPANEQTSASPPDEPPIPPPPDAKARPVQVDGPPPKADEPPELLDRPPRLVEPPPRLRVGVLYNVDARPTILSAVFSADGRRVLVGTNDTVWLYDLQHVRADNKPMVPPLRYPFVQQLADRRPLAIHLSSAGDRVLFGTIDLVREPGQLRPASPIVALWEVDSPDVPRVFDGAKRDIHCVALAPGGSLRALSGGRDNSVCLWNLEKHDRRFLRFLTKHTDTVDAVAFSPDGRHALSGGRDRAVCLWDLEEARHLFTFEGHEGWITCVVPSPDGQSVLSGSDDATARLWSLKDRPRPPRELRGHNGAVRCAAFSPDGRQALTGGDDATLRLWEVKTGRQLTSFSHDRQVVAVAFSPDGRYALSVGKDNAICRWELPQ